MSVHVDVDTPDGVHALTVEGLTRLAWSTLLDAHPSTDPGMVYDPAGFEPALIAACTGVDEATAAALAADTDIGPDLLGLCLHLSAPRGWEWATTRLAKDGRLRAEVACATKAGVPVSVFLGWPERDQDLALAQHQAEVDVCPGCGVPAGDMRDPYAWEPDVRGCWHCIALGNARSQYRRGLEQAHGGDVPDGEGEGHHFILVRGGT